MAALRFLVKHGFAEPSTAKEGRFKMITDGPSPAEAAKILCALGKGQAVLPRAE
jgi:hypothetical protein